MKLLLVAVFAITAAGVTSCKKEPVNPENPTVDFKTDEGTTKALTLVVPTDGNGAEGDNITVSATYEWKIIETDLPSGITIDPKTAKKGETTVNVKVDAFEEGREVAVVFVLSDYASSKATLTIKQQSASVASTIYYEDAGTNVQSDPESGWPFVDQYEGWRPISRIEGMSQDQVTYSGSGASVRQRSSYPSLPDFSAGPHVFMNSTGGTTREFVIGNINITGYDKFIFSTYAISYDGTVNVEKTTDIIKMYGSFDGEGWAPLTVTIGEGTDWTLVKSEFAVPTGTNTLYIKIETQTDYQNRFDDFTLVAGGNGSVITPPTKPTAEEKTLTQVREMGAGSITGNYYFKASIISDASADGGNSTSLRNIVVSDGQAGIMIRLAANPTATYNVGDEVQVDLYNQQLSEYEGLLQVLDIPESKITKTGQTKNITHKEITATELLTDNYQSMLVAVKDVQFKIMYAGKAINDASVVDPVSGHAEAIMEDEDGTEIMMFVSKYSKFFTTPITLPANSGVIKGIAGINGEEIQVQPQTAADFSGLDQPRFGEDDKYFGVTANDNLNVSATVTSVRFTVSANVNWSVQPTAYSDLEGFTIHPATGDGDASVTVSFGENTSTENTRYFTIKFSTTDEGVPADDRSYEFTINQDKVSSGGGTQGVYTSNVGLPSADNSDLKHYIQKANIGGTEYDVLKLGTGSVVGTYTTPTITSTAGDLTLSFYAVCWNNKTDCPMKITVNNGGMIDGGASKTFSVGPNAGAAGNPTYTITFNDDTDYYEVRLTGVTTATTLTIETTDATNPRVILAGINVN